MSSSELMQSILELQKAIFHPPESVYSDYEKEDLIDEKLTVLLTKYGSMIGRLRLQPEEYEKIKELDSRMTEISNLMIKKALITNTKKMNIIQEILRLASQVDEFCSIIENKKQPMKSNEALKLAKIIRNDLYEEKKSLASMLTGCKTICRYLGISSKNEWIDDEVKGYFDKYATVGELLQKIPDYRKGKIIFYIDNSKVSPLPYEELKQFAEHAIGEPVAELENYADNYTLVGSPVIDLLNRHIFEHIVNKDPILFNQIKVRKAELPFMQIKKALDGIKTRISEFLDGVILELEYGGIPEAIFEQVRQEVDHKLTLLCPSAIEKLTVTYDQLSKAQNPEVYSQVASTCRRIIKDVADALYPPTTDIVMTDDGKSIKLDENSYKNRILQSMKSVGTGDTEQAFVLSMFDYIDAFLSAINSYASKGDHSKFNKTDATRCIVYTYLLLGDILHYYTNKEKTI